MKTRLKIISLILLIAAGALFVSRRVQIMEFVQGWQQPELPPAVSYEQVKEEVENKQLKLETDDPGWKEPEPVDIALNLPEAEEEEEMLEALEVLEVDDGLPSQMNLAVPFTPQAPHANWDLPYQEACEEASLFMVHEYYKGRPAGRIDATNAEEELLKLVEFQKVLFGDYLDTTAAQTALLAEQMYGYSRVELIFEPTVEMIKNHLAAGRPVIVPAAGRQLGNPYFVQPGPVYHMLVIRGYTEKGFITNDPGTRRGEGYYYSFDAIMNAMHDWNGGDVENGQKILIVIYPEN